MTSNLNYKSFFREEEDRQFWGNQGAGALIVAKDTGKLLLGLRSPHVNEPGTWNLIGGAIDEDEDPRDAAKREVWEETGYDGPSKLSLLYTFKHRDFRYYNFLMLVPSQNEVNPVRNWEHSAFEWVEFGDWPTPLHFGLNNVLKHAGSKIQHVIELIKKKKTDEPGNRNN